MSNRTAATMTMVLALTMVAGIAPALASGGSSVAEVVEVAYVGPSEGPVVNGSRFVTTGYVYPAGTLDDEDCSDLFSPCGVRRDGSAQYPDSVMMKFQCHGEEMPGIEGSLEAVVNGELPNCQVIQNSTAKDATAFDTTAFDTTTHRTLLSLSPLNGSGSITARIRLAQPPSPR